MIRYEKNHDPAHKRVSDFRFSALSENMQILSYLFNLFYSSVRKVWILKEVISVFEDYSNAILLIPGGMIL